MATRKKSTPAPARPAKREATKKRAATAARKTTPAAAKRTRVTRPPAKRAAPTVRVREALQREVEQLLYHQSELLDGKAWQAFIDLFTEDGIYWAPVDPSHTHWDGMPAIFIEDRDLMSVRMKRMQHPNAWSQQAEWGTTHVVGNVTIERVERNGDIHVRSRFHLMEQRRDDLRHFGGIYRHHLVRTRDGLRIKLQRADLLNAQAPFEYVLQAWV